MLLSGPGQLSIEIPLGSMVINHEEAPEKISVGFSVGTSSNGRNIVKRSDFRSDCGFFGRIMIKPTDCSHSISTSALFCLSVFLHLILPIVCLHSEAFVLPSCWQEVHPSDIRICYLAWHLRHLHFVKIAVSSGVISPYPILLFLCKKVVGECSWRC